MTTRRNIGGRYVEVRERNTSKGHRGTITGNWSSKQKLENNKNNENFLAWGIVFIIFLLLLWVIYIYFIK